MRKSQRKHTHAANTNAYGDDCCIPTQIHNSMPIIPAHTHTETHTIQTGMHTLLITQRCSPPPYCSPWSPASAPPRPAWRDVSSGTLLSGDAAHDATREHVMPHMMPHVMPRTWARVNGFMRVRELLGGDKDVEICAG